MDSKKRSTLFTLGAIVAGYAALRTIPSLLPEKLELEPLEYPTGVILRLLLSILPRSNQAAGGDDKFEAE